MVLERIGKFFVKHNPAYKKLENQIESLTKENSELEFLLNGFDIAMQEQVREAEEREEALKEQYEEKYRLLEQRNSELQTKNIRLQTELSELQDTKVLISKLKEDIQGSLDNYKKLIYNKYVAIRGARIDALDDKEKEKGSIHKDYKRWQKNTEKILEKKFETADRIADRLKGFAIGSAISILVYLDQGMKKIPFAFYDFANRDLYCSEGTLKLFDAKHKQKLTLKELMKNVKREYRKEIFNSLDEGTGLRHYKARTPDDKELRLSTYPFFYDNKAVGVGIFLRDPLLSGTKIKKYRVVGKMTKIVEDLGERFEEVAHSIKEEVESEYRKRPFID